MPTTADQLVDHRQFAGQSTLDLTTLGDPDRSRTVHLITQAAGEVGLRLPASLNATVVVRRPLGRHPRTAVDATPVSTSAA